MISILVPTLFAIAVVLLCYYGSRPYHHRGIRPGALPDFFANLFRDADESRMVIEDERTRVKFVVKRVSGRRAEVVFRIFSAERSGAENPPREVTCHRKDQAAAAIEVLLAEFRAKGSDSAATFHIYFRAKSGTDDLRERWETMLSDPSSSEFRREVARRGLTKIANANDENSRKRY